MVLVRATSTSPENNATLIPPIGEPPSSATTRPAIVAGGSRRKSIPIGLALTVEIGAPEAIRQLGSTRLKNAGSFRSGKSAQRMPPYNSARAWGCTVGWKVARA